MNIEIGAGTTSPETAAYSGVEIPQAQPTIDTRRINVYAHSIEDGGESNDEKFFDVVLSVSICDDTNVVGYSSFKVIKRIGVNKCVLADQVLSGNGVTIVESSSGGFLNDPKTLERFKKLAGV